MTNAAILNSIKKKKRKIQQKYLCDYTFECRKNKNETEENVYVDIVEYSQISKIVSVKRQFFLCDNNKTDT